MLETERRKDDEQPQSSCRFPTYGPIQCATRLNGQNYFDMLSHSHEGERVPEEISHFGVMNEPLKNGRTAEGPFSSAPDARAAVSNVGTFEERVLTELDRVLASRTFQGAEAQRRFLRYAVEHTISGNANEVKEYTLGVHVFSRGELFDPRLDPIVRVEARKLRTRLTKFYDSEGGQLRIELPPRGYVPFFREVTQEEAADVSSPEIGLVPQETLERGRHPDETQPSLTKELPDGLQEGHANGQITSQPQSPSAKHAGVIPRLAVPRWAGLVAASLLLASLAIYAGRLILQGRGAEEPPASIAVLPFQNLGAKDDSFSDGLTAELIDSLGRVQGLQVVARTSAFQFRGTDADIRDIGKKLNVRTVLEGSVRTYGNRLRITAELDDAVNGFRMWSDSYERDFADVLLVQRDISQAIVTALQDHLAQTGAPNQLKFSPVKAGPVNAEAYRDYLRGVYFWNKQTSESIETAKRYFESAIALDPSYAAYYTGLARCYVNLPAFSTARASEVAPKIRELANKALELDSGLPEGHIDLAYAAFLDYDWDKANAEFRKGLALSPGDAVAHRLYSAYLIDVGRLKESLAESEIAQQLDPVSPYMLEGTGRALLRLRRYDEAIQSFKKSLALDPEYGYGHLALGLTYIEQRKYPDAFAELKLAQEHMGNSPTPIAAMARAYALSGQSEKARQILEQFLGQAAKGSFPAKPIADVYLALGDKERALEWLARGTSARDVHMYLLSDPAYDDLKSDAGFQHLLENTGLKKSF